MYEPVAQDMKVKDEVNTELLLAKPIIAGDTWGS